MYSKMEWITSLSGTKDAEVALAHTLGGIFSGHCSILMGRA